MGDNMKLWQAVEKTDPRHTKKAKLGRMTITAIAPQYQLMLATNQFGPYGKGWGFKHIEHDYSLLKDYNLVVFKGVFFFPGGEFPITNSAKIYMNRENTMLDDDFAKKIETDTLTKALSKLGFNADVFMGRFDDSRYVQQLEDEIQQKESANVDQQWQEWLNDALSAISQCKTVDEIGKLLNQVAKQAEQGGKPEFVDTLRQAATQRKEEIGG